jgi:ubiquinone/menaquinone biosynthesis C-methylase UbiE
MKTISVFDKYAHEYDILTNATARAKNHRLEVKALIDRFQPDSVLDAGCASGLTTALFAEEGVRALGLDRSSRMITVAKSKFSEGQLPLSFRTGHFERLPQALNGKFDLVVCLANSISGVGTVSNLKRSLAGFRRVLRSGGTLVLQMLNLASIKEGEVMPVKATQWGDVGYLRFARRRAERMEITVVRLDFSIVPFGFEPFVHEVESFSPARLTQEVGSAGFRRIARFGDLLLTHPFKRSSHDLVITAFRP